MFKIVRREEMAQGTVILNEIEAPLIAKKAKPGQFVILKAHETGERISAISEIVLSKTAACISAGPAIPLAMQVMVPFFTALNELIKLHTRVILQA